MNLVTTDSQPGGLVVRSTPDGASITAWCGDHEIAVTLTEHQRKRVAEALQNPGEEIVMLSGFRSIGAVATLEA